MHFLSLETSTQTFSLSVSRDNKVLRSRNIKSAQVLENSIIGSIDKLLASANLEFDQLDAFAIALGPGSFTSLRVGLSTVKAFCMATGKPLVGISSLDVIAGGIPKGKYDQICVINDARRGNVYAAIYGQAGLTGEYMLTTIDDVLTKIDGTTLFVGNAIAIYKKQIEDAYKAYAQKHKSTCTPLFADEKYWQPQAKVLASLAFERLSKKNYDRFETLLPMYLYAEDCQVHKGASK